MLVLEVLIAFMLVHLATTQSLSKQYTGFPNIVEAVFGETYERNSTRNQEYLFEYSYNHTYVRLRSHDAYWCKIKIIYLNENPTLNILLY